MNAAAAKPTALVSAFISALSHGRLTVITTAQDVQRRLFGLGYKRVCSRCIGSGNYGPMSVQSGKCFDCAGKGETLPTLTRELLLKVRTEVKAETLGEYADRLIAAKRARIEAKRADERVSAGYPATLFMRTFYGPDGKGRGNREEMPFSWLAYAIHDNEKAARDAFFEASSALRFGTGTAEAVLAAEAAVVRARKVQDLAFAAAMSSGEIGADQRKVAEMKAAGASHDEEMAARQAAWVRAEELLSLAGMALGE